MEFNQNQKEAINTVDGNMVVIAAAGSGKTSVLTYRILNMVQNHNIMPSSILAVTFSKKAKESIEQRLSKLGVRGVNVETFHSLALKVIRTTYGYNKYKVWNALWEKEKILEDICCNQLRLCSTKDDVKYNEILRFISIQKTNMLSPTDNLIFYDDEPYMDLCMRKIYILYEQYKAEKSYIEFDDFLNMANECFVKYPDVLKQFQNKYTYVLSDEFQDVSMSQSILLKKINQTNTMIVGDPLQAIYSFRGGRSEYIMKFDQDYSDVKVVHLNTNYRCSSDIVQTANMLAQHIPDSKDKNYLESVAAKSQNKIPEFRKFENEFKEAEWICKKILTQKENNYKYKDIAILSRTNAQLTFVQTVMSEYGIPYDVVNGSMFTDLPENKLLISYLKLALHEGDNAAFSYIYNKPNRWLDQKFFEEVKQNATKKNTSLYNAMFTIDRRNWRFKGGIDEIYEIVNILQNKSFKSVGDMISFLRNRLDIDQYVSKGKQSDDGSYSEQIENMNSLQKIAEKYTDLENFILYLDDINKQFEMKRSDKVHLSTIHRAKGLEYPIVYIIGMNNGLLPHRKNDNTDDERRLMYVGITRAEDELYLSSTDSYNDQSMGISPFIGELRDTIKIKASRE